MLERFSLSVSVATMMAVLGKLAFLYHAEVEAGRDWFVGPVDQVVLGTLLIALFLIFFRGKMMHDDATFFQDLAARARFRSGRGYSLLIKFGLLCGYCSWLLWAPAIFFLEDHARFSAFLIASLALSTIWLLLDIATRREREWRRVFWIIPNVCYIIGFSFFALPAWTSLAAIALLFLLVADWLVSDPLSGHIL